MKLLQLILMKYNMWMKNRKNKQGGGVRMLTRKELQVKEVFLGERHEEMMEVKVKRAVNGLRTLVVVYVPPKTSSWNLDEYNTILKDTRDCLDRIMSKNDRLVLLEDSNSNDVCWEDLTATGGITSRGCRLLTLSKKNTLAHWVRENTRYRENEEPPRLDLVFTKEPEIVDNMEYKRPAGKVTTR